VVAIASGEKKLRADGNHRRLRCVHAYVERPFDAGGKSKLLAKTPRILMSGTIAVLMPEAIRRFESNKKGLFGV
jgi:hypothetical protein